MVDKVPKRRLCQLTSLCSVLSFGFPDLKARTDRFSCNVSAELPPYTA